MQIIWLLHLWWLEGSRVYGVEARNWRIYVVVEPTSNNINMGGELVCRIYSRESQQD